MAIDGVVESICRMPLDLRRLGNVTMIDLMRSSGYLEDPDAVTEARLEEFLRKCPELVSAWEAESDRRSRYGWGLSRRGEKDWVVDYPNGRKYRVFDDGFTACAFYVKWKLEGLRGHHPSERP
jgi:hypothetical protein